MLMLMPGRTPPDVPSVTWPERTKVVVGGADVSVSVTVPRAATPWQVPVTRATPLAFAVINPVALIVSTTVLLDCQPVQEAETSRCVRSEKVKAAEQGSLMADERQTVPEFLTRWLQDVARTRVRPRTLAGYEAAVERHISPYLGRQRLARLTPQHLQAWLAALEAGGIP